MKIATAITICLVSISIGMVFGYSLRHTEWQEGTPKWFEKVVLVMEGKEYVGMFTGKVWTEYADDGIVFQYNGTPEKWRYIIW